jgi:4-hydroxybenzoate polyprenyltransferase
MLFLPLLTNIALVALVVCGWIYNAAPLRLSRRPVASIVVLFLAYGILPFCIGVGLGNVNGHGLLPFILLGSGWGLLRASLSLLKDYKDAAGDAAFGKRTFLLRYGATKVWQYSIGLCATGFVLVIVAVWLLGVSIAGLAALAAVAGWLLYERTALIGKNKSYLELNQTFHKCLHYQLIFDSLVLVWLVS